MSQGRGREKVTDGLANEAEPNLNQPWWIGGERVGGEGYDEAFGNFWRADGAVFLLFLLLLHPVVSEVGNDRTGRGGERMGDGD